MGDCVKDLLVHVAHVSRLLTQLEADPKVSRTLLVEAELGLLEQALPGLAAHQLHQHVQGLRPEVHGRRVREVLVDVLERAGGPEEVVHGRVEPLLCASILSRPDLSVETTDVEEDRGFFKRNCSLATWHTRQ